MRRLPPGDFFTDEQFRNVLMPPVVQTKLNTDQTTSRTMGAGW
ncbi:MAG: hypothetical protein R3E93_06865 [Thiothrix sp.]